MAQDVKNFVLGTGDYSDSTWSWTKERVFDVTNTVAATTTTYTDSDTPRDNLFIWKAAPAIAR